MTVPDLRDSTPSGAPWSSTSGHRAATRGPTRGRSRIAWTRSSRPLPDAAWTEPVSASDVPGAPPWTLLDHVGHVADWLDEAIRYVQPIVDGTAGWPRDEDYTGGGDFDAWNEGRRGTWSGQTAAEVRAWHRASADRLIDLARRLPPDLAGSDEAWEWIWHLVISHPIEHVALVAADDPSAEPA